MYDAAARQRKREYRAGNLEACKARCKKYGAIARERKRVLVRELKTRGCVGCGECEPVCLDFHHLDSQTKRYRIADPRCATEKDIRDEAAKCILLCANCHRKLTRNERRKRDA